MAPTLIVLALLAIAVAIVVRAVRKKPSAPPTVLIDEPDTAWNDSVTPAGSAYDPAKPSEEPRP